MDELYLVTGANGHLGNTVVQELLRQGKKVRVLVLPGDKLSIFDKTQVEIVYGDICKAESLNGFFCDLEGKELIVIHSAGIVTIATKYQQNVFDVNVTGTKNIVEMCKKHNVKKLIYVSSVHAIPERKIGKAIEEVSEFDPDKVFGLYAKTKAQASQIVLDAAKSGLNACVVHPSGIIGPYDYGHGHSTQLIIDIIKGKLTAYVNGGYDFVDVRDVADGILSCCERGRTGECYILSCGYYSVWDLLNYMQTLTGKKMIKTVLPLWFVKLTAPLSEAYYKILNQPPLFTAYSIYTLGCNSNFSHRKATEELRYNTRPIMDTLSDTVKWLKEQKRI